MGFPPAKIQPAQIYSLPPLPYYHAFVKLSSTEIVTFLLQKCYKSVTAPMPYITRARRTYGRTSRTCIQYTYLTSQKSWNLRRRSEIMRHKLQAGNHIRAGAAKNQIHRFLARGELQRSAGHRKQRDPPQAGIPSSWKFGAPLKRKFITS